MLIYSDPSPIAPVLGEAVDKVGEMVLSALEELAKYAKDKIEEVASEYVPLLEDFVKNMSGEIKGIAFGKEVDQLDMSTLVGFAKTYIVPNCNEVVAIKKESADCTYIYLSYSKDRQLLPTTNNKYLVIKTKSLSKDVVELFADSKIVILK